MKKELQKEEEEKWFDWNLDFEIEALYWPIAEVIVMIALALYC